MTSSLTVIVVLQVPETLAHSRSDMYLAICAQTDSGNATGSGSQFESAKPILAASESVSNILQILKSVSVERTTRKYPTMYKTK